VVRKRGFKPKLKEVNKIYCQLLALRIQFKSLTRQQFWLSTENKYADMKQKMAINILIQFVLTYSRESDFLKLVSIKTKYRYPLDSEVDLRIAISNTVPNMEAIDHQIFASAYLTLNSYNEMFKFNKYFYSYTEIKLLFQKIMCCIEMAYKRKCQK
jgi:hypothetical protein